MEVVKNLLKFVPYAKDCFALFLLVATLAIEIEKPGNGESKKNEVVGKIRTEISKPGGIELPSVLLSDLMLGSMVNIALTVLNKMGFMAFWSKFKE